MEYRRLTKEDAVQYRELRLIALQTDADAFSTSFREANERPLSATIENLENPDAKSFGAFSGESLISTMTLIQLQGQKTQHRAELVAVYTAEKARGIGAASGLFDYLLAYIRSEGKLEQLELAVNAANQQAIRFYERCGFQRIGMTPNAQKADGRSIDELLMLMPLKKEGQ